MWNRTEWPFSVPYYRSHLVWPLESRCAEEIEVSRSFKTQQISSSSIDNFETGLNFFTVCLHCCFELSLYRYGLVGLVRVEFPLCRFKRWLSWQRFKSDLIYKVDLSSVVYEGVDGNAIYVQVYLWLLATWADREDIFSVLVLVWLVHTVYFALSTKSRIGEVTFLLALATFTICCRTLASMWKIVPTCEALLWLASGLDLNWWVDSI